MGDVTTKKKGEKKTAAAKYKCCQCPSCFFYSETRKEKDTKALRQSLCSSFVVQLTVLGLYACVFLCVDTVFSTSVPMHTPVEIFRVCVAMPEVGKVHDWHRFLEQRL